MTYYLTQNRNDYLVLLKYKDTIFSGHLLKHPHMSNLTSSLITRLLKKSKVLLQL